MQEQTFRNIRHLDSAALDEYLKQKGEPSFRTKQIEEWLWKKGVSSFEAMTNISKKLREQLQEDFFLPALSVHAFQKAADDTIKLRFKTFDGHFIEGVLIPAERRYTACVSSQVGCSLNCRFCATGYLGRKRNLFFDEIFDQVVLLNQTSLTHFNHPLTNIVFMGMGEPLLNYSNVRKAIERITSTDGLAMSPRRITVSTAGIAKAIRRLADDKLRCKLALSLHAANDAKRSRVMNINETNNIATLIEALNYFYHQTRNEITFEYILLKNFNDTLKDAEELVKLYRQTDGADLINIIEYNPIDFARFEKPDEQTIHRFTEYLRNKKVNVRIRKSRGKDIDAACGQLANKALA
ncbi:MAG: 23S rRNA (adenine(2503)-C(2))-methyltransferase RlmN [Chitinophagaceae bacterium]|nr:23S rRNA (adenine(2503)-C(2))-methyltransferase RlmN [Chitinophagaceae bacterium]